MTFEQRRVVGERFSRVFMGSLVDQTEAALARVLRLCSGGVGQQDVDALQRHDEAALALLDINDDDAVEVCGPPRHSERNSYQANILIAWLGSRRHSCPLLHCCGRQQAALSRT